MPSIIGYESAYVVGEYAMQNLQGRLLTFIESLGLREGQEKAVKDIIYQHVWKTIEGCLWISGEEHTGLQDKRNGPQGSVGTVIKSPSL